MNHLRTVGILIAALALGAVSTLVVQRVRAAGIPATETLTYTGYLESQDGTAVNTPQAINLYVYNAATGGNPLCQAMPGTATSVVSGHFQIPLPPECTTAVKQNPELWIEVQVGGIALGRTKLGAVPYAVEAKHAMDCDSATNATSAVTAMNANTALEATHAASAGPASGASAHKTKPQDIPSGTNVPIVFELEDYDIGNELDHLSGVFTTNQPGYYVVICSVDFDGVGPYVIDLDAAGRIVAHEEFTSATGRATTVVKLAKGERVVCVVTNSSGDQRSLRVGSVWEQTQNAISVHRLAIAP